MSKDNCHSVIGINDDVPSTSCPNNIRKGKSISIGDRYIVEYDEQRFPGEVVVVVGEEFLVSVMQRAGKYWKWSTQKNVIYYMQDKMISKLDVPEVANNRRHFKLSVWI